MMGGFGAHEYMAPCPAGENDVALAPGYAANVEVASAEPQPVELPAAAAASRELVETPGHDHGRGGRRRARRARRRAAQGLSRSIVGDGELRLVMLRGDHRVNDIKLQQRARRRVPAGAARRSSRTGSARPATSARSARTCRSCSTAASRRAATSTGANRPDAHLRGVEPGPRLRLRARRRPHASRPATPSTATRSGSSRRSRSATSSSSARATPSRSARPTSTRPGTAQLIWMGSYGIGPARIAAAAVEQFADEHGHLVAARDRAVRRRARRPRQARARRSASSPSGSTSELRGDRPRRALRRPRRRPGRRSSPTPSCSACRCG